MSLFFSAFQLVIRRSLANWKLLSAVIIGVVVAVALVSSTPLYSNTLSDLGLARALRDKPIELLDVHVYAPNYPVVTEEYLENGGLIRSQVYKNIGSVIRQEEQYIKTPTFYVGWADRPIPTGPDRPKGHFQVFTNLDQHVTLVDGRYHVSPDDIRQVAPPALRHRMILNFEGEAEGIKSDEVIKEIIAEIPAAKV